MTENAIATYLVEGMSCNSCAASVSEEVGEIDGVTDVTADAATGRLEVEGTDVSDEHVRDAVEEAGYRVAGRA